MINKKKIQELEGEKKDLKGQIKEFKEKINNLELEKKELENIKFKKKKKKNE